MPDGAPRGADRALWAAAQARLLREGRLGEVDVEGLAEAVERLGQRQREALQDHLAALVVRLLLWKYMPGARLPSWRADIAAERRAVGDLLAASPSLAAELPSAFAESYRRGRRRAAAETGIAPDILPTAPPFTLDEARDEAFMPLEPSVERYRGPLRSGDHVAADPVQHPGAVL